MPKVARRTFSLPPGQAAYIDAKVENGAYASGSEVRAGLRGVCRGTRPLHEAQGPSLKRRIVVFAPEASSRRHPARGLRL